MTRRLRFFGITLVAGMLCGCGYHLAGQRLNGGRGLTVAIPTFVNRTTTYRIEQRMTEAVRQEFIRTTRFSVQPGESADLVVSGEVLAFTANPVIFNPQGRGSSYSIIIDMKITMTDTRSKKVIYKEDRTTFRDVFELAQNSTQFAPEDTAAMDRLSRRFAQWFVETVMQAKI